jgi:hypothetical protein
MNDKERLKTGFRRKGLNNVNFEKKAVLRRIRGKKCIRVQKTKNLSEFFKNLE